MKRFKVRTGPLQECTGKRVEDPEEVRAAHAAASMATQGGGQMGRMRRRASANVLRADTSRIDVLKGVTWNEEIRYVLAKLEGGKIYQDIQVAVR